MLATVEGVSTLENVPGDTGMVANGKTNVWFDDEVVITGLELELMLVSSGEIVGRPGDVKEVLTVLENNGVEDAVCVSTSTVETVVFRR